MLKTLLTYTIISMCFSGLSQASGYQKYEVETGNIVYDVYLKDSIIGSISMSFSDYGSKEIYYLAGVFKDSVKYLIVEDSVVIKVLSNNSVVNQVSCENPLSPFIMNMHHPCYSNISLAKPAKRKFLGKKCDIFYHYRVGDSSGVILYYKGIPVGITSKDDLSSWHLKARFINF